MLCAFLPYTTWISYTDTFTPSRLSLPPTRTAPSGSSQSTGPSTRAPQQLPRPTLHVAVYTRQSHFLSSSRLSFPHCVQKSVFYVSVSIPALHICPSAPLFYIPYIWINTVFFSFLLTSFYTLNSRFIPITTNDPVSLLSVAEQCVCILAQSCPTLTLGYHGL